MNILAKNQTNLLITLIIIIGMAIFFKFINKTTPIENFENENENNNESEPDQNDFMNDDSLLALQDFTKFAVQGPKGDKGDKGDEGREGEKGEKGEKGKTGEDFTSLITTTGKLWLGGFNSGKSGYDKNNEIQLYLGGSQGQGANGGRQGETTYKLKIDGYDNSTSDVYPLYCMDKGGNTDFYVKNRTSVYNKAKVYINGSLNVVSDIYLNRNSYIKSNHLFNLASKESINLYARDSINIKKINNANFPSTGNLKIEGNLTLESDALIKKNLRVNGKSYFNGDIDTQNSRFIFKKKAKILNVEVGTESGNGISIGTAARGVIYLGSKTKLVGDNNGFHIQQKVGNSWRTITHFTSSSIDMKKSVVARENLRVDRSATVRQNISVSGRVSGNLSVSGNMTVGGSMTVSADMTAYGNGRFGPAYIGNYGGSRNRNGGFAQFSHYNRRSNTAYAILHQNNGTTFINSSNWIHFRKNNGDRANINMKEANLWNLHRVYTYFLAPRVTTWYNRNWFAKYFIDLGGRKGDIILLKRRGDNLPGFSYTGVDGGARRKVSWNFVDDNRHQDRGGHNQSVPPYLF